jgi:thiol-disulfide isomerase/thioredoxin
MTPGLIAVLAVLVLGTGLGLWRRRTDGRFRSVPGTVVAVSSAAGGGEAGSGIGVGVSSAAVGGVPGSGVGVGVSSATVGGATGSGDGDGPVDGTVPIAGVGPVDARTGPETLDPALLAALGVGPAQATLLQFSSAFCAPCRAVRRVSSEVAAMVSGVQHVEVDAESHLEAVRALGIWRTPTLLVLDSQGRVVKRATGVPGKPQLIAVLGEILPMSASGD